MKKHFTTIRLVLVLAALLAGGSFTARAQNGSVGIGTTAPDASAALDIVSSNKGALLPRVANVASVANPATGLILFQTGGTPGYYYNAGTAAVPSWQKLVDATQLAVVNTSISTLNGQANFLSNFVFNLDSRVINLDNRVTILNNSVTSLAANAVTSASNGLSKSGNNVVLGGSLTSPVTILQAGNALRLTGGNVGIGTATPSATLETQGDFRVSNGLTTASLGTTGTGNYVLNNGSIDVGQSFTLPMGGTITSIQLVSTSTYSTTFMLYNGGGNGGSALTPPQAISFVAGTPTLVALTTPINVSGTTTLVLAQANGLRAFLGSSYPGGNVYFGSGPSGSLDLEFAVNYTTGAATNAFYVATSGNVGIGTSGTPSQKLDVTGGSIKISTAGQGLIFPDGSTQTTAAGAGSTGGIVASNAPLSGSGTGASPLQINQVTNSTDGYLSSANFNSITDQLNTTRDGVSMLNSRVTILDVESINLRNRVSNVQNDVNNLAASKLSYITASTPLSGDGTAASPLIIATATATTTGALTSADFTTFSNKGTFTLPTLNSGSVLFSNGSSIAQNNSSFFWDDANGRLGLGTTAPAQKLDVTGGSIKISTAGQGLIFPDGSTLTTAAGAGNSTVVAGPGLSSSISGTTTTVKLGGTSLTAATDVPLGGQNLTFSGSGNVGIGTSTPPTQKLDVNGNMRVGAASTPGKVMTQTTGTNNMLAVAYGMTGYNGTGVYNGSGNFTVTHPSIGKYTITFIGGSGLTTALLYAANVSLYGPGGPAVGFISYDSNTAGTITVYTMDTAGALSNNYYFSFSAYAP